MWRDPDGYDPLDVDCLVWGGRTATGDRGYSWAAIRSRIERDGTVDDPDWVEVLDLERALRLMASPLMADGRGRRQEMQARRAAMLIAAHLLMGYDVRELRSLLPVGEDPLRLMRAGATWIAAYLSGQTVEACEAAFAEVMRPRDEEEAA